MTPNGRDAVAEASDGKHIEAQVNLLEQILSRENMLLAWKRVKANKGAAGMDGMSIDAFPEFARHYWERIRSALEKGTYRPAAVLRVMIPKATGGQRPLGIPTVLDRVIQQAIAQVIGPLIEGKLALVINRTKSKAARLGECTFLGFGIRRGKLHWTDAAVQRFKERVREITSRSNGQNVRSRIEALRRYVTGWLNYYGHSRSYSQLLELDQWLRRRVRLGYWKQWKRPRTRRRHLLALGIPRDEVKLATRSRKGYWRMAGNSIVQRALTKQWLWDQGVPNMRQQWVALHYPEPRGTG